jgi:hypothetical protein
MTDADLFQEFSKEAIQAASKAKSESERLALNDLALTWLNAALQRDRISVQAFRPSTEAGVRWIDLSRVIRRAPCHTSISLPSSIRRTVSMAS